MFYTAVVDSSVRRATHRELRPSTLSPTSPSGPHLECPDAQSGQEIRDMKAGGVEYAGPGDQRY